MLNGIYNIARRNSIQKRQNYGRKGERAISKKKTSALLFAVIFTAGLNAHSFSVNLQSDSYSQGDTISALLKDFNFNLSMRKDNNSYRTVIRGNENFIKWMKTIGTNNPKNSHKYSRWLFSIGETLN